jgi:large subunit ribosomal protein L24
MSKLRLKIGDRVKIIAGSDKDNLGTIKSFCKKKSMVIIENFNLKFKHAKAKTQENSGEIKRIEAPIHISNVMLCDVDDVASRFKMTIVDGKKLRLSKRTNKTIL